MPDPTPLPNPNSMIHIYSMQTCTHFRSNLMHWALPGTDSLDNIDHLLVSDGELSQSLCFLIHLWNQLTVKEWRCITLTKIFKAKAASQDLKKNGDTYKSFGPILTELG